jgi:hypothetical protein
LSCDARSGVGSAEAGERERNWDSERDLGVRDGDLDGDLDSEWDRDLDLVPDLERELRRERER